MRRLTAAATGCARRCSSSSPCPPAHAGRAGTSALAPAPAPGAHSRAYAQPAARQQGPRPAPLRPARPPPRTSAGTVPGSAWCRPGWPTAQPKLQRQGAKALAAVQRPRCLHHVTRRLQRRLAAVAVRAHHEALSHRSLSGVAAAPWCAHLDIRLHHVVQSRQRPLHLDERCALHAGDLG